MREAFYCDFCGMPTPGALWAKGSEEYPNACPWCALNERIGDEGVDKLPHCEQESCGVWLHPEKGCPCGWRTLTKQAEKALKAKEGEG